MKTPPLLMSAALLLWGWQAGFILWAILMAVVIESARFSSSRWNFADTDWHRIWDLCFVLFLGAAVILYTSDNTIDRPFLFAQWQPFIFLPMMLAQAFGSREKIPLATFSWFLRRAKKHPWRSKGLNFSYLYFSVCLLGASACNRTSVWFYPAVMAVISGALLAVKPRRFSIFLWTVMLTLVGVGGYFAQRVLHEKQASVEAAVGQWLIQFFRRQPDLRQSRTAIGQIGKIKLSGKIVWRVTPEKKGSPPELLHESTYDSYKNGVWWASRMDFIPTSFGTNDTIYLLPPKSPPQQAWIAGALPRGRGLIPLPQGSFELIDLIAALETNSLAVARVKEGGPGFINFAACYGPGASLDGPTNEVDFALPENEKPTLDEIVRRLDLAPKSDDEKIRVIQQFFANNFTYSLYLSEEQVDRTGAETPLRLFLTKVRSGHCEYFATATVLLLRAAGIPARYAVGYSVQETANQGKSYIVRERHAHAWTLVYRNGFWEDFDTTPPSWGDIEAERASLWEGVRDFWARIGFEFSKWRWSKVSYTQYLVWLLVPLVLFLAWRILFNQQRQRKVRGRGENEKRTLRPGLDSEFYLIERKMTELGVGRGAGETLAQWRERAGQAALISEKKLGAVLFLHQRYRFDPNGLTPDERWQLKKDAEELLAELNQHPLKKGG